MDLGNYGIGGNEVKIDASEAYCGNSTKPNVIGGTVDKRRTGGSRSDRRLDQHRRSVCTFPAGNRYRVLGCGGGSRRGKFPFSKCRRFFCQEDDGTESFLVRTECGETVCGQDGEVIALQQGVAAGTGKSGDTRGFRQCDFRHSGRFEEQREV